MTQNNKYNEKIRYNNNNNNNNNNMYDEKSRYICCKHNIIK